ncbi:MAG: formyltetrahydrofolate deformylase [Rhodospirillales bacterium 12-54-5]|nr:MAG: formyltetrahydrofolate deformylase [Rhodospirillales bacterium 12-54-5]
MIEPRLILTLSCPDIRGIVAAVSGFLAQHDCFINESTQFGDPSTNRFFMRVDFSTGTAAPNADALRKLFDLNIAAPFAMEWAMHDAATKARVVILVSKELHCLNDLLHRTRNGRLAADVVAVISNHPDARSIVEWAGIPYYHFPMDVGKPAQEAQVWEVIERERADFVVLARYMQILSPELSAKLRGKAVNIHHSFLPSFKGAKPYHQAYERGVKLIGATAHFVTDALDEGPIIDQEVMRVDHADSPDMLAAIGQDIEALVIARALGYLLDHRVLMNGHKTVVFG